LNSADFSSLLYTKLFKRNENNLYKHMKPRCDYCSTVFNGIKSDIQMTKLQTDAYK